MPQLLPALHQAAHIIARKPARSRTVVQVLTPGDHPLSCNREAGTNRHLYKAVTGLDAFAKKHDLGLEHAVAVAAGRHDERRKVLGVKVGVAVVRIGGIQGEPVVVVGNVPHLVKVSPARPTSLFW
jgi:hypothetical protein